MTWAGSNQTSIQLRRQADGADLGDGFGKADLATAAPAGGRLLHLAAFLGRPAAVVGAVLAADPSAAGVADGSGRLPLALAASAGCSGEALALLHAAHPAAGLELGPVAEYIVRTAETAADLEAVLAAAPAGAAGAELPPLNWYAGPAAGSAGVERKKGDAVVLRAGLAERKGSSGLLRAGQPAVKAKVYSRPTSSCSGRPTGRPSATASARWTWRPQCRWAGGCCTWRRSVGGRQR